MSEAFMHNISNVYKNVTCSITLILQKRKMGTEKNNLSKVILDVK